MLDYSEVKEHKYIIYENEPWEVLTSHVFRKQQRKPVNAVKLRNFMTGRITETTFHFIGNVERSLGNAASHKISELYGIDWLPLLLSKDVRSKHLPRLVFIDNVFVLFNFAVIKHGRLI